MSNGNFHGLKEFDRHRLIISLPDESGNLIGYIAIHRGNNITPSFGATRIWQYGSEDEALNDVLRLSKLMSYKAAMAGLPYGGAKAVLFNGLNKPAHRAAVINAYAQKVNYLRGSFITGADVGINQNDIEIMANESKYIVGLKTDPVRFTVLGLYYAIQACLNEVFGSESIKGRTFAIQGLGKTGYSLLKLLYKDAEKIYVCDLDEKKIAQVKNEFPKVEVVPLNEIYKQKVDVFSPCALGNILTKKTVPLLQCKIIAGCANNQLEDDTIGEVLYEKGILYAPDYVINAGGLIAVVEEYESPQIRIKRISERVEGIKKRVQEIITKSKEQRKATNRVADEMAENIFNNL